MLCLAALAPSRVDADASVLIVQQGDALSSIAKRAGVSVEEIKHWNELDGDMIRIGQKLIVGQGSGAEAIGGRDRLDPALRLRRCSFENQGDAKRTSNRSARPVQCGRDPPFGRRGGREESPSAAEPIAFKKATRSPRSLFGTARTVGELLASNPGLRADRIFPGQTIDIGSPRPEVVFKLERGDNLLAVASRYDVSPRDLSRWNAGLSHRDPRPGTQVRLYTRVPVSPSQAIGPTNRGRLENGVRLPSHRGYLIRSPARAYGTEETTRWIVERIQCGGVEVQAAQGRPHSRHQRPRRRQAPRPQEPPKRT